MESSAWQLTTKFYVVCGISESKNKRRDTKAIPIATQLGLERKWAALEERLNVTREDFDQLTRTE
jgi:hypothetical protein